MKVASVMARVIHLVNSRLFILVEVLLLVMAVIIARETFGRYLFDAPTTWVFESTELILLAITFMGAAYTWQAGANVKVDLLIEHLPARVRDILFIITSTLALIYTVVLGWQSWGLFLSSYRNGAVTIGLTEFPLAPFQILMPVGCFLLSLTIVESTIRRISALTKRADRNKDVRDSDGMVAI
ncbi:TRAP transporter small permease subunit [Chloroflexota bacterium]